MSKIFIMVSFAALGFIFAAMGALGVAGSLVCILLLCFIVRTKTDKLCCIHFRDVPLLFVAGILSIFFALCAYTYGPYNVKEELHNHFSVDCHLSILVVLAMIALPAIVYILDWIHENQGRECVFHKGYDLLVKLAGVFCLVVALCAIIAASILSFSHYIWLDEAATLAVISQPYDVIVSVTAQDVHPPLYYFYVKSFSSIINSFCPDLSHISAARICSLLPFITLYSIIFTKLAKEWGWIAAVLCSIVFAGMPHFFPLFTEIRMYSLAVLFVSVSYIYFGAILHKPVFVNKLIFVISSICGIYTHNYACLAIVPLYILLGYWAFVKNKQLIVSWFIISGITVVSYLPWLCVVVNQIQEVNNNGFWIQPVTVATVCYSFAYLIKSPVLLLWIVALSYLLYSRKQHPLDDATEFFLKSGSSCLLFTYAISFLVSIVSQPIFTNRYLLCCCGPLWISCCIVSARYFNSRVRLSFILIVVIVSLTCILGDIGKQYSQNKETTRFEEFINNHKHAVFVSDTIDISILSQMSDVECYKINPPERHWHALFFKDFVSFASYDDFCDMLSQKEEVFFVRYGSKALPDYIKDDCNLVDSYAMNPCAKIYAVRLPCHK